MSDQAPYVNQLSRWDDDDLRLSAQQVELLMLHPGWQALSRLLDESRTNAEGRLYSGQLPDDRELTRVLGFIQGLSQARIAAEAFGTAAERRRKQNESKGDRDGRGQRRER